MNVAVLTRGWELDSFANKALKGATAFWFAVLLIGQAIFAVYIVSFYGRGVVDGDLSRWNRLLTVGYVPGDIAGNFALAVHLLFAAIITIGGPLQLFPQIRARAPTFHRWNGRVYVLTAVTAAVAGFYMIWTRPTVGGFAQHMGSSLNAALIVLCGAMAARYAIARDFKSHRRWAIRVFLVVSGSWFFRVGVFVWTFANPDHPGFDSTTLLGPTMDIMSFAQSLAPLAVFELYLLAQGAARAPGRIAMAAGLAAITVAMGVGISALAATTWVPNIKAAYDMRISIADTLFATLSKHGFDAADRQYHDIKSGEHSAYNFDESELNNLGYKLIRNKRFGDAIRILQLNAEAYPQSSNTWDSLAEAYLNDGNTPQAIAYYHKALELDPKKQSAVQALQKLNAP